MFRSPSGRGAPLIFVSAAVAIAAVLALTVVLVTRPADDGSRDTPPKQVAGNDTAPPPPRLTAEERLRMQRALNNVVTDGSSGAVAELVETNPGGSDVWNGVAGVAQRGRNVPVDPGAHFRIASLSKPFASAVLLQLVGEGKADLDDPVDQHLPGVLEHGGDTITLRMLLSHTSGLFSYNRDMPSVLSDRDRVWRPEELVAVANRHEPVFEPGTDVAYSNTNYVLVGMVIEALTGRPYSTEIENRILKPLDLTETSIPDDPVMPDPALHAYLAVPPSSGMAPQPLDITEFNPSRWFGTAQIVSTVSDINTFYAALFGGQVLDQPMLKEMQTVVAIDSQGVGYGLGPKHYTLTCGVKVWMHSGNIPGFRNWSVHSKERHFTMFQARYQKNPDPPAWEIIETAMCPADAPKEPEPSPSDFPSEPVTGPEHDRGRS
ncbi:serine hydrolase domain-containing protein [Murinocardiopsis flavida]|uniref:serine hydrolase domain-containing protein n=1 Tax=Murinocardiopsis flavida TaxID=645275 RepID=UPI001FE9AF01|nr:serine hydrolase domain-containing protein [Murinocardiopsis flavida]